MLRISFVGDINPGGVLTFMGGVSQNVVDYFADADLRVGTLESALGDGSKMCSIKMSNPRNGAIIYSPDEAIATLKKLEINIVTLANNHICDLDAEGLKHTIEVLRDNGILFLGAGETLNEASAPLFITIKGKTICFLAYMEDCVPGIRFAKKDSAGVNPFNPKQVVCDIKKYRDSCDYLVVMPHWGKENTIWPKLSVIRWCKMFKDAGADAIIGSHPHVAQPIVIEGNTVIAPSLGNFLFPDRYINTPRITVYPNEEERSKQTIPTVYTYPLVKELTFKVISDLSRVGEILSINLGDDIETSVENKFVHLDKSNTLLMEEPNYVFLDKYTAVLRMLKRPYIFRMFQLSAIAILLFGKRLYESERLRNLFHLKIKH